MRQARLLAVGVACLAGIWVQTAGLAQPAPELARKLAQALEIRATNQIGRLLSFGDSGRAILEESLKNVKDYFAAFRATTNWGEFIRSSFSSNDGIRHIHLTFQFYFGYRTNFDDQSLRERLFLVHPLPVADAGLSLDERRALAEKDKLYRLLWLEVVISDPEKALVTTPAPMIVCHYLVKFMSDLFVLPHLHETLTLEDWETVERGLQVLEQWSSLTPEAQDKLAQALVEGFGRNRDSVKKELSEMRYVAQGDHLHGFSKAVLNPERTEYDGAVATNLVVAFLEPLELWLQDQCWNLGQLYEAITNVSWQASKGTPQMEVANRLQNPWAYLVSATDRRTIQGFIDGLNLLKPGAMSMWSSPGSGQDGKVEWSQQPHGLTPRQKRFLPVVNAYCRFDPEAPELQRALAAVERGDLRYLQRTPCVELAMRNMSEPLELLRRWAKLLPENRTLQDSLSNIENRLEQLAQRVKAHRGIVVALPNQPQ